MAIVIDSGCPSPTFLVVTAKPTETIAVSEFKATGLAVLEPVPRTGTSIVVAKRRELVAEIKPPSPNSTGAGWLGSICGTVTLADDLMEPASATSDWDACGP
jgi:hypothetical protein